MSGMSNHDFGALHRFLRRFLGDPEYPTYTERIDAVRRGVDLLERGMDAKIPKVWVQEQLDSIRRELLRIEDEL